MSFLNGIGHSHSIDYSPRCGRCHEPQYHNSEFGQSYLLGLVCLLTARNVG